MGSAPERAARLRVVQAVEAGGRVAPQGRQGVRAGHAGVGGHAIDAQDLKRRIELLLGCARPSLGTGHRKVAYVEAYLAVITAASLTASAP